MLSTLNKVGSMRVLHYLALEQKPEAEALLTAFHTRIDFLLAFVSPSARNRAFASYLYLGLLHYPGFIIAVGEPRATGSMALLSADTDVELADAEAQAVVEELMAEKKLDQTLTGKMHLLVPFSAVKLSKERAAAAAATGADEDSSIAKENAKHAEINEQVLAILRRLPNAGRTYVAQSSLWEFVRRNPDLSIEDGVLYDKETGESVNLYTFLRESTKDVRHSLPFGGGGRKRKATTPIELACAPIAAVLLSSRSFPPHLIRNAKLVKLADKLNKQ